MLDALFTLNPELFNLQIIPLLVRQPDTATHPAVYVLRRLRPVGVHPAGVLWLYLRGGAGARACHLRSASLAAVRTWLERAALRGCARDHDRDVPHALAAVSSELTFSLHTHCLRQHACVICSRATRQRLGN